MKQLAKRLVPQPVRQRLVAMHRRFRPVWFAGDHVDCPICGSRHREFLTFGRPPRQNAQCPQCGSLERHRALYAYLRRDTDLLTRPGRLLHFAPEQCLERALRSSGKLRIVTLDLERVDVAVRGDITRLPFPSASFDGVICSHVLEHIPDDAGAMRELRRVLRPGGTILIQVPQSGKQHTYEDWSITSAEERIKHFGQEDHVRWYGEDLVDRLRVAGLKVAIESPIEYRQVYGFKDERIYRCQSQ